MYFDLWPYVWLVFKSGFLSRAGYSGAHSGMKNIRIKSIERKSEKIETGIALFVKRATEA